MKEKLKTASFVIPACAVYIIIVLYPTVYSIYISLTKWSGVGEKTFVGLDNYINLILKDELFLKALKNTVTWTIWTILITVVLALLLALALNRRFKGRLAYRAIFYFPNMLSWIVVGIVWKWMYNPNFGMINSVLSTMHLDSLRGAYLTDTSIALFCVYLAALWQGIGQPMLYFLAGLQTLPGDVMEAAKIDGAGVVNCFFHVTVPMLKETFVIVLATQIIAALKVYDIIYVMTDGGPANATQTLATYMYDQTFKFNNLGTGSAIATIMVIIMMAFIVPYIAFTMKED